MKLQTFPIGIYCANCYVLTDEKSGETAIFDPGCLTDELKKAVDTVASVKYIFLTHGHFDHINGAFDLRRYTGAPVAIHEADADCLFDEKKSYAKKGEFPFKPMHADILLHEGDAFSLGGSSITVMHTPGHTKGGVCFVLESERMIFSGDTLFRSTVGRMDFKGGSAQEMAESIKRLRRLDGDYNVYPGHSRCTTLSRERERNFYMRRLDRI